MTPGEIIVGFARGTVWKVDPTDVTAPLVLWTHQGLENSLAPGPLAIAGDVKGTAQSRSERSVLGRDERL